MILKINKVFLGLTLAILLVEICIAVFLSDGFIRHTFGDFLVVILIYCFIRSFLEAKPLYIASAVLVFAFLIEFLQLFKFLDYLNLRHNELAVIILGSTFNMSDLIAYTLGVISIFLIDKHISISWKP